MLPVLAMSCRVNKDKFSPKLDLTHGPWCHPAFWTGQWQKWADVWAQALALYREHF